MLEQLISEKESRNKSQNKSKGTNLARNNGAFATGYGNIFCWIFYWLLGSLDKIGGRIATKTAAKAIANKKAWYHCKRSKIKDVTKYFPNTLAYR